MCRNICWIIGIIAGFIALWMAMEPVSLLAALFLGVAVAAFVGLVLNSLFCHASTAPKGTVNVSDQEIGAAKMVSAVVETNKCTKPKGLSGPRDGRPDDLKQIKGIGPKLEILCNEMGFYHFDQIASWAADEVVYMNQNLKGFKGRVSRDTWVKQATLLAAGGETEFSKRVEKGSVYNR